MPSSRSHRPIKAPRPEVSSSNEGSIRTEGENFQLFEAGISGRCGYEHQNISSCCNQALPNHPTVCKTKTLSLFPTCNTAEYVR